MRTARRFLLVVFALTSASGALAQASGDSTTAPRGLSLPGSRAYLGLNVSRTRPDVACPATALACDTRDQVTNVYAGTMFGSHWGAELATMDSGRLWRPAGESRTQGLNMSLVGRAQPFRSLGVYGKVGTVYGRTESTAVMGNGPAAAPLADQGFGLSWGGGVSYEVTPRLSATFELDSYDVRIGGTREPVRSTSLGLQLRY